MTFDHQLHKRIVKHTSISQEVRIIIIYYDELYISMFNSNLDLKTKNIVPFAFGFLRLHNQLNNCNRRT